MSKQNIFGRNQNNVITSDDILGKDVIDAEGKFVGVVESVLINPSTLEFVGISIDKGFLKKGLTIGKSYIEKITKYAVFLHIKLVLELKGKEVFDKNGRSLGKITEIELWGKKNKIKNLIIHKQKIPGDYIETIGSNVILSIHKSELPHSNNK